MKKKEFKRLEFLFSMGIQIAGQMVALKKLQVEELKLKQNFSSANEAKTNSGEKIKTEATPKRDFFGELEEMFDPANKKGLFPSGMLVSSDFSKRTDQIPTESVVTKWVKENCACPRCTEERKQNGA